MVGDAKEVGEGLCVQGKTFVAAQARGLGRIVNADPPDEPLAPEVTVELPGRVPDVAIVAKRLRVQDQQALAELPGQSDGKAARAAPVGIGHPETVIRPVEPVADGLGSRPMVDPVVARAARDQRIGRIAVPDIVGEPASPLRILDAEQLYLAERRQQDKPAATSDVGVDALHDRFAAEPELIRPGDRVHDDRVVVGEVLGL